MFEKTKLLMTLTFALCFLAYSFLIGKFYERINMSRTVMIIICAVLSVIVAAVFLWDVFKKIPDDQQHRDISEK